MVERPLAAEPAAYLTKARQNLDAARRMLDASLLEPSAAAAIEHIRRHILERDPEAVLSDLYPAPDPGTWIMDAYVSAEVAEDFEFEAAHAELEVDLLLEHGVHIATLFGERRHPLPFRLIPPIPHCG